MANLGWDERRLHEVLMLSGTGLAERVHRSGLRIGIHELLAGSAHCSAVLVATVATAAEPAGTIQLVAL